MTQEKVGRVYVISMPFYGFSGQPRQSIIVVRQSRRYVADACHAYNYSRSAL